VLTGMLTGIVWGWLDTGWAEHSVVAGQQTMEVEQSVADVETAERV